MDSIVINIKFNIMKFNMNKSEFYLKFILKMNFIFLKSEGFLVNKSDVARFYKMSVDKGEDIALEKNDRFNNDQVWV